eukprot:1822763-Ditylum_brightwellii.AAC.1
MATNLICHKIYKQAVNSLCQLCGKYDETIVNIASGCNMLCSTKYTKHHNKNKAEESLTICLEDGHTLMYNMKQRVNHGMAANHPDIVYLDKKRRTALLINDTCPMDVNMFSAAATKHKNYHYLEIAMKKQHKLCKIQTVPIVIGALVTMYQNFDTNLAKVSLCACAATIQKEVLL